VGVALAAQFMGMALSSIPGAKMIEHRSLVMRVIYAVGWGMRAQVLGLALSAYFLSGSIALVAAFIFLALFGFFGGMQGVAFSLLMSKVIPVQQRGRLTGMRNFLGGLAASGVAYLGGTYLVGTNFLGSGYGSTFMVAFILTSIGISALSFIREPKSLVTRKSSSLLQRLADVPAILKEDVHYRRFLFARALAALGTAAVPFYVLYVGKFVELSGGTLGYLSLAFLLAQTISNLMWGRIADKHGYRLVFILSVGMWSVSMFGLLMVSTLPLFLLAFCGLGAGFGGYQVASQNFVLEFGRGGHDLPMLIALSDTASHLMMALGPILGGLIASRFDYASLFWIAFLFKVISVLLILGVQEPRQRKQCSDAAT
jgi:MFS family permease